MRTVLRWLLVVGMMLAGSIGPSPVMGGVTDPIPAEATQCPLLLARARIAGISSDRNAIRYAFSVVSNSSDVVSAKVGLALSDGSMATVVDVASIHPVGDGRYLAGIDMWRSGRLASSASIMEVTGPDGTATKCVPSWARILAEDGFATSVDVVDSRLVPKLDGDGVSVATYSAAWYSSDVSPTVGPLTVFNRSGRVKAHVSVGPNGLIGTPTMVQSSGDLSLDRAFTAFLNHATFYPPLYNGVAMNADYDLTFGVIGGNDGSDNDCPVKFTNASITQVGKNGSRWLLAINATASTVDLKSADLVLHSADGKVAISDRRNVFDFPDVRPGTIPARGEVVRYLAPPSFPTYFEYEWTGGAVGSVSVGDADAGSGATTCRGRPLTIAPVGSSGPTGDFNASTPLIPIHPAVFASLVLPDTSSMADAAADHAVDVIVTADQDGTAASAVAVSVKTDNAYAAAALSAAMASRYDVTDADKTASTILYHVRYGYVTTRQGYINAVVGGTLLTK